MNSRTLPWLARLVIRMIVGPDAEVLQGDLEEGFRARLRERGSSFRVRLTIVADACSSLVRWWWRRLSGLAPGGDFAAELPYVWRGLLRRPGYAAVVVITLGLGIGATTTIYTVVDALLVRPLPYPDAERLVLLGNTVPGQEWVDQREGLQRLEQVSFPSLVDLERRTRGVERVAAVERMSWIISDPASGLAEVVDLAAVTPAFFELLGVRAHMGRLPRPGDAPEGAGWNAVISYEGWQRRFGGDPDAIGKMTTGGLTLTIVGVTPPGFQQPAAIVGSDVEFWVLLDPTNPRYQPRTRRSVRVIAQLASGMTLDQARRDLAVAQAQLARDEPAGNTMSDGQPLGAGLNWLRDETVGSAGRPALPFLGAAVLLLLLAATNAANLMLVRGLERSAELALRQAIGAGRGRLVWGLIGEGVTLALAGGLAGLAVAAVGVGLLHRFGPASLPRLAEVGLNLRVAAVSIVLSTGVGVGIGLVPALRAGSADLLASLRSSVHAVTPPGARLRSALAATQLALALILGVGAVLMLRSFVQLTGARLGFQPAGLVAFTVPLKAQRHWEVWDRVITELRALPGVTGAAMASSLPFETAHWGPRVGRADGGRDPAGAGISGYTVTPAFFAVAGIPIVLGRAFDGTDQPESRAVAIINQSLARALFGEQDPLGNRVRLADERGAPRELEIVGVVGDVVQARLEDGIGPAIYVPHTQSIGIPRVLLASDRRPNAALDVEIQRAVLPAFQRPLPLRDLATMPARIAATRAGPRFRLLVIGAFAGSALVLAAIGLYGTLAFTVRSRTRELGIRLAVGATPQQVYRLVLLHGLRIFGIGAIVGVGGALAITRVLQGFLYRLTPVDPFSFGATVAALAAVVVLAALRPAGRAARIDPMIKHSRRGVTGKA